MLDTELGIVSDVKLEQPLKAPLPLLVTESEAPLFVTSAGIVIRSVRNLKPVSNCVVSSVFELFLTY